MEKRTLERLQREFAPLFVLAVLLVPVIVALGWGHLASQRPKRPPDEVTGSFLLAPTMLGDQPPELADADRASLLQLLFECLEALKASRPLPVPAGITELCTQKLDAAVFATIYAQDRGSVRAMAREATLAESTSLAARRLFEHPSFAAKGFREAERLSAQLDIVTEEEPLPPVQRRQFALLELASPFGLALWHKGTPRVVLPGDIAADKRVANHLDMLRVLCQEAGLQPDGWQGKKQRVCLLRTDSFISAAPGSTQAMRLVRGLPHVREAGLASAMQSRRLAADYLVRNQQADGWFTGSQDALTGMVSGRRSMRAQARAAAALARFCAMAGAQSEKEQAACRRALVPMWQCVQVSAAQPSMAFVKPPGEAGEPSLADSAAVLRAFCECRRLTQEKTWDDVIGRLGSFVLLLQREDGGFGAAEEPTEGQALSAMPSGDAAVQAEAALALALAYEVAGDPRFLLGARKALDHLGDDRQALGQTGAACTFIAAVLKLATFLPWDSHAPAARRALETIMASQLSAEDAPAPDLVGSTMRGFPPPSDRTAAELEALAGGWLLGQSCPDGDLGQLRGALRQASLNAARYVVHLQFIPENSYYLANPDAVQGGFRSQPGSNAVTLESVQCALDGLGVLTQAITVEMGTADDQEG